MKLLKNRLGSNSPSISIDKDRSSEPVQAADVVDRYVEMIQNLPQVVFEIDMEGRWYFLNNSWTQLSGFDVDECIGTPYADYVHPQDRPRCKEVFEKMQHGEVNACTDAFRFLVSDANYLWTEIHAAPAQTTGNQPFGIVGTINNITERVSEEELLRANQRTLTAMLNDLPGMVYRCRNNPDWTMEYVSGSSFELTGYHPQEIINNKRLSYASMIHPQDKLGVWEEVQNAVRENRRFELVYRIITESGAKKTVWECGKGIFSNSNEWLGLEGFIIDFTRQRANAQNLLQHALYDDLTELPSLPLFLDRLENAMQRSFGKNHRAALIVVHLDRVLNALEQVDSEVANKTSFEVCKRLLTITDPLDSLTRLNNERWGILIENQDVELSISSLAQDIQDLFLLPVTIGKSEIYFTTSIGAVLCTELHQSGEELLRNASHAMHCAHALGGSRFEIFDGQIHKKYAASV